ncbi:imidazole glycerol phosphate synthase subunit HisH [Algicola sagamiensis]|uniref:imidazole glycerol phosphate synthase subunit HisH n=1 Tax=Algicola sagamiensis TaxID=163869 RepID=UPI00037045BC|nr:imidazole glycerol phosphate synthase subunit HisH [Algicola sagamiensis]
MTVILNTGCGNLNSVRFALERLGQTVEMTADKATILSAERVIFPGVGSAEYAMEQLRQSGLDTLLPELSQPVLGICLGMQLLTDSSTETTETVTKTLSLIPGQTEALSNEGVRLPHMGWNQLQTISDHPLFHGITQEDFFYFVHGYGVKPSEYTIATCEYGQAFSAAIAKQNMMGVQFHPERSGLSGEKILRNFLEISA